MLVGHYEVPFASSELATYFKRVVGLTLPLRPDMSGYGGADGTMYELAVFGDLWSAWRFQWWSSSPEQWRPMVDLVAEMHAAFTAARGHSAEEDRGDATAFETHSVIGASHLTGPTHAIETSPSLVKSVVCKLLGSDCPE